MKSLCHDWHGRRGLMSDVLASLLGGESSGVWVESSVALAEPVVVVRMRHKTDVARGRAGCLDIGWHRAMINVLGMAMGLGNLFRLQKKRRLLV